MSKKNNERLIIYNVPLSTDGLAPLVSERVQAGFPSPAENYIEDQLDLNRYCVKNPTATFFVRVDGESMTGAGIYPGDLLVVDRSVTAGNGDIVVAILNGEFTLKRLVLRNGRVCLCPDNPAYRQIEVNEGIEFEVWGKVTKVVHEL